MPHLIDFAATQDPSGEWDWSADFSDTTLNQSGVADSAAEAWECICAATRAPRVTMIVGETVGMESD